MLKSSRRSFLGYTGAASALALAGCSSVAETSGPKVVVVGGGFGGATAARWVKHFDPNANVTLVEANRTFVTCPFSNAVLGGIYSMDQITHGYGTLPKAGVKVVHATATGIDAQKKQLTTGDGPIAYDRLILSPGIDIRWGALPGYDEAASELAPHAWKAGPQTVLLRKQLEAMADGGTVIMVVPPDPFRCPPGPYERASMIAHYLKTKKPRSKLLVLDAKDTFSKQGLFIEGWNMHYKDIVKWVPLKDGGKVTAVDVKALTAKTDFDTHKANVMNVIPPQRAGAIAEKAGVADQTGWCPVDLVTFESKLQKNVHVIGDAAIMPGMPKSGHSANAQAKACALAVVTLFKGGQPKPAMVSNTCYSLITPDHGISVTNVWQATPEKFDPKVAAVSPAGRDAQFRKLEANYARSWYANITREVWG